MASVSVSVAGSSSTITKAQLMSLVESMGEAEVLTFFSTSRHYAEEGAVKVVEYGGLEQSAVFVKAVA